MNEQPIDGGNLDSAFDAHASMVMVPRKPTWEMQQAALEMNRGFHTTGVRPLPETYELWASAEVYRAMIAAAPAPAVPTGKAPCARHCEATAFRNEIRRLEHELRSAAPAVPLTDEQLLDIYWQAGWNADGKAPMRGYEREQAHIIVRGLRAVLAHGIGGGSK